MYALKKKKKKPFSNAELKFISYFDALCRNIALTVSLNLNLNFMSTHSSGREIATESQMWMPCLLTESSATHRFVFMKTYVIPNEMCASMLIDTFNSIRITVCTVLKIDFIRHRHLTFYCKHSHTHY